MTPFHRATMLGLASLGLLALAACTTTSPNDGYGNQGSSYPSQTRCADCGIVTRIDVLASTRSAPAATGTVLGGIVGAVAGAAAGKAIQDRVTGDTYNIHVRMDDGRTLVINQHDLRGIRENTYVRVVNGKVVLR